METTSSSSIDTSIKEKKRLPMVEDNHQNQQTADVRGQQLQPQLDRSLFLSASSTKSIKMVPNKRRPIKKRMRPQFLPQQHQLVSPIVEKTTNTIRKPETLDDDSPPLPTPRMLQYSPTTLDTSKTPVLMEEDHILNWSEEEEEDDDGNSTFICVDKSVPKPVPVGVTPPRLQRRKGSFFARTVKHKHFLEQQSARAAQEASDRFLITSSSKPMIRSFKVSVSQDGESIFHNSVPSKKCLMEDDVDDGEIVYEHMNIDEFYKAFNATQNRAAASAAQILSSPQLAKTDSDSMCIMMKDLFVHSSRCNSMETAILMYHMAHPQQTQDFQNTHQHASFSSYMEGQHQQKGDDIMDDAFATMQFPMITTPKRSFRLKKNSFASFASSASGSSRSSCVTPSPAKRMIAPRINTDIEMPHFDHRPSRSMGSLDGLSDMSVQPCKDGYLASPPAFPELLDPVNALRFVTKNSRLSEGQKVDQAKQFLVIPPKLKPKLPPRHVGRTLSGTKGLRKTGENGIFGYKRSLSEDMEWVMNGPAYGFGYGQRDVSGGAVGSTFHGQQGAPVPVAQNGMVDFRRIQQQHHHWHQQQLYGYYCDASQGFDGSHFLPQAVNIDTTERVGNHMSWIHQQQPTLDSFHPPSGGGRAVDRSNPISDKIVSHAVHRSISRF